MSDVQLEILESLRTVHDPCCSKQGISVVDMGLIRSIAMNGDKARIELMLTSGWCPFQTSLLETIRANAESVEGVRHASVEITWDETWTMDRLSEDARSKLVFLPAPISVPDRDRYIDIHERKGIRND